MNEKLSLQDLVDVLSKKAKITKKDADSFFREFFQLILERIFDNDSVKIKDFGTFKLISVSNRESVNVNTGEKIEIPSHYKLSFIPDKILKNLVNKPFSQFETILLEDGVVFETSVENEDSISEDEEAVESPDLDIENEDDDIVSEIEKPIIAEPAPIIVTTNNTPVREKDTEETKPEKETKPQSSSKQIYPRSFVYTYTTSKPSEESDSITLTVPKEDLVRSVSKPEEKEPEPPVREDSEQKGFPIELLDLPHVPVEEAKDEIDVQEEVGAYDEVEDEPKEIEEKAVEVEPEDAQEEPSQPVSIMNEASLKDIISDDLELESDFDSEIETEEDIIIPVPIPIIDRLAKEKKEPVNTSEAQNTSKVEKKSSFSNEDPERPLFPVEEEDAIAASDFVATDKSVDKVAEISEENNRRVNPLAGGDSGSYAGNNKPAETRSVSFSDKIDPVDIPYHDFNSPYLGSRFRKWLPVALFLLVIIAFLTYGLIKMLNKPYDFESNLGRTNLTLSDTLPFVDEVSPKVKATDAMLDSMKKLQAEGLKDSVKPSKKEPVVPIAKEPAVEKKAEATKPNIVGDTDSLTRDLINKEKDGFVISDKLKFGILNKAEFHLAKFQKESQSEQVSNLSGKAQAESNAASNSKPKYDTIKRGTTLRTLAATHYGSPDYWVYIYQANKKNILNPNNVPIGTRLLIPPLSDYGVYNPKDAKEIQVAKNLEAKILGLR